MLEGAKRKFDAGGICCRHQSSITYHDKQFVDRIIFMLKILISNSVAEILLLTTIFYFSNLV